MEAREEDIAAGIEDGAMVDPHGMDPETVLRFVRAVGGWPGKVMVIACEPANVEEPGMGLTPEVAATVDRAVDLVAETVGELQSDAAYAS
jgi:hydrogenase maturation protease